MEESEAKAAKDCRPCDRRRVKCDRSLPTCKKCVKKGLDCPGYGLILQWDQGVASRGNLAGKSVPVLSRKPKLKVTLKGTHVHPRTNPTYNCRDIPKNDDPSLISNHTNFVSEDGQLIPFNHSQQKASPLADFTFGRNLVPFSIPLLESRTTRLFLNHYDQVLAGNMAWTDCDDNPWRSIMMSMAMQSPPLMFSILAFAAKHMSAMANSSLMPELSMEAAGHSKTFVRQALQLLAQNLRPATEDHDSTDTISRKGNSNAVLASMLVLANVETVWPDSSVWKVHLNAARTVLAAKAEQDTDSSTDDRHSVSQFLGQELFIASTFASITSFSQPEGIDPLQQEPGGVFVDFLKLLQMITRLERQAFANPDVLQNSNVTPLDLEILFERARAHTLKMSSKFKFAPRDGAHQFNRIVNAFYHAGLIYSFRALFSFTPARTDPISWKSDINDQLIRSRGDLFEILEAMEMDTPTYAQDLVFPLFIAGTEASTIEKQEMVVQKLRQAMRGTGFSNCEQAVQFLRAFWLHCDVELMVSDGTIQADSSSWINFAREWANQGHVFLVF